MAFKKKEEEEGKYSHLFFYGFTKAEVASSLPIAEESLKSSLFDMCTKKSSSKNFSHISDNGREQTEIDEDAVNLK